MEIGTYLLILRDRDCYIIDQMKLMGSAPCYSYVTLEDAMAAKERLNKEMVYDVLIVQIVKTGDK